MRRGQLSIGSIAGFLLGLFLLTGAGLVQAPTIQSMLKPQVYRRAIEQRDVMTHAKIDGERYSYYAVMLVRAGFSQTRSILTNYELYSKLISYIDEAKFDPRTHVLEIRGSFMGWTMHSWIQFEEKSEGWIHYRFIRGHFTGMSGDMYFESLGDKGSLVYMGGGLTQSHWPGIPKLILEWGAEIVFGFTGNHMRSYIESNHLPSEPTSKPQGKTDDQNIPQPRSRL